jgi:hypothetical protein
MCTRIAERTCKDHAYSKGSSLLKKLFCFLPISLISYYSKHFLLITKFAFQLLDLVNVENPAEFFSSLDVPSINKLI